MTSKKKSLGFFQYLTLKTLWYDSFPQSCQLLSFLISNLQLFAILINCRFSFLKTSGHDDFSKAIHHVSQVITLDKILISSEDNWLVGMFLAWVYLCVIILGISYLLYTHHYQQRTMASSSLIMTFIGQFHLSMGFFWTAHILLRLNQDGILESMQDDEQILIGGAGWAKGLNWLFLIVSYLFGAFFAIYSFDPFMSSSLFASHNSVFQTFTFALKAFAVPFLSQSVDSKPALWVFVIFTLIFAGLRLYYLFESFPYYHQLAMKTAIMTSLVSSFITFSNFLAIAFSEDSRVQAKIFCYLDLLFIPLSLKVGDIWFEKNKMTYLRFPDEKLKTEEAVLKKLFFVRCLISQFKLTINENQKFNINEVYFWSVFVKYSEMNRTENCTQGIGNIDIEKLKNFKSNFGETIIKDLLQSSIQRIRQSNKIKTLFIYSFLDRPEYLSCLIYFLSTLSRSRGYSQILVRKLEVKIQTVIERFFNDREGRILNIKTYIDMQTISLNFFNKIHDAGKSYEDFWTYYNRSGLKMTTLYEKSSEIEKLDDEIQYQWKKSIEVNPSFAKLLSGVYSMYLSLIRNCPYSAQRIFDKYWNNSLEVSNKNEEDITNLKIYDERNITIHASMSKEKLGKIVYASPNIAENLGFQHQNLIGKNINVLMPSFMQENHNQILIEHLNKVKDIQRTSMLYTNIDLFVLDTGGFIIPCKLYLSVHPYIQRELVYVAMIKIKEGQKDTILVDNDGNIQGYTQNAGLQLNLRGSKKTHIEEICKGYFATMKDEDHIANKKLSFLISKTKRDTFSFLRKIMIEQESLKSEKDEFLKGLNLSLNLASVGSISFAPKAFPVKLRIEEICGNKIFILEFEKLFLENSKTTFEFSTLINSPKEGEDAEYNDGVPEGRVGTADEFPLTSPTGSRRQFLFGNKQRDIENALLTSHQVLKFTEALSPRGYSKMVIPSFANPEDEKKTKIEKGRVHEHLRTKQDEDDEVLSLTSSKNAYAALERSIQGVSQNEKLNKLRILMFFLLIISSIILIILEEDNNETLGLAEKDIEILNQAIMRMSKTTLIGRLALVELMSLTGLFLDTRYKSIGYVYPMKYIAMVDMGEYAGQLNEYKNGIRNSLYQIDKDLQGSLYEDRIPVYNSDDGVDIRLEKSVNLFDLTDEIIARAQKAFKSPVPKFTLENPDLLFLVNNTFNGGIMVGEEVVEILQDDCYTKLEHRETISRMMIIIMAFAGLFLILVVSQIQLKFLKKRNQLIEIFLYLDRSPLRQFELLEKFLEDLEQSHMDCNYFNLRLKKDQGLIKKKTLKTQNSRSNHETNSKIARRTGDMSGINTRLFVIWVLIFLFALGLMIIFIVLLPSVDKQNERIVYKTEIMAQSSLTLYKFTLMRAMLYYYIFSNGTAEMKELPIRDQWDSIVDNLARSPSFFLDKVLDKEHGMGDNEELVSLVKGNICNLVTGGGSARPFCTSLGGGVMTGGILSFNSYSLAALRESKQVFDSSGKTFDDMEKALDIENLILVEIMEVSFMDSVYSLVNGLTKKQLIEDIQEYKDSFLKLIIIYIILSLVLGNIIWVAIVSALEKEISNANKLLKRVPIPLIEKNKLLQSYLVKNNRLNDAKIGK